LVGWFLKGKKSFADQQLEENFEKSIENFYGHFISEK
jgi:hypothetical protein